MLERLGDGSDDLEAERPPQSYGCVVDSTTALNCIAA